MWEPPGAGESGQPSRPALPEPPVESPTERLLEPPPERLVDPPAAAVSAPHRPPVVAPPPIPAADPSAIPTLTSAATPALSDATVTLTAIPPRRRFWPFAVLAILTIAASGALSWFVATSVDDDQVPVSAELLDGAQPDDVTATQVTGSTIEPTTLDAGATAAVTPDFLATEPFAAAAAKIAPSVVQLTLDGGLGTGVIIDESGFILTAAHVVGTNTELDVRLYDGSTVAGTVIGTHEPTDVAVVQIDGEALDLTPAPLADGDEVRVGQLAVAVGSPFGFDQTVTAGIISAVDRVVNNVSMVQTDAPINPGNSGGPLIDLDGRVVGINDLIFTQSGSSAGVGFAISIDLAMVVAEQLIAGEDVQLALLGVTTMPSPDGAAGALVEQIVEGSAAAAAGLQVGDLVVSVDGVPTRGSSSLRAQVIDNPPGTVLEFGLIRNGVRTTLMATLGSTG